MNKTNGMKIIKGLSKAQKEVSKAYNKATPKQQMLIKGTGATITGTLASYVENIAPNEKTTISNEGVSHINHHLLEKTTRGKNISAKENRRIKNHSNTSKKAQVSIIQKNLQRKKDGEIIHKYIRDSFEASSLPPLIKEIGPYIPRQESRGRWTITSSAGAQGLRQFMPGTGRQFGLTRSNRKDPIKSTNAAISFLESRYKKLSQYPSYLTLKEKVAKEGHELDDSFICYATINSYNSGIAHITKALDVLVEQERKSGYEYFKNAHYHSIGFFDRMTNEYPKDRKQYQKGMKYKYYNESPNYVYEIIEWYNYDTYGKSIPNNSDAVAGKNHTGEKKSSPIANHDLILGAASAGVIGHAAYKTITDKKNTSRRDFLKTIGRGAATGAGLYAFGKLLPTAASTVTSALPQTTNNGNHKSAPIPTPEQVQEKYSIELQHTIAIYKNHIKNGDYEGIVKVHKGLLKKEDSYFVHKPYYIMQQHMGDIAYENYINDPKQKKHLYLSLYFYNKALETSQEQKTGKYRLPEGGQQTVDERIEYCKQALAVVHEKLSN